MIGRAPTNVGLVLALAISLCCVPAIAAPGSMYQPPVEPEPSTPPYAFFGKLRASGKWCALSRSQLNQPSVADQLSEDEFAWVSRGLAKLISVSVELNSEDAYVVDRYLFDSRGRIVRMVRTGHYIKDPFASFNYVPNAKGDLVLTPDSRVIVRRMEQAGYETYFLEWPRYASLGAMPFGRLVNAPLSDRARPGCDVTSTQGKVP